MNDLIVEQMRFGLSVCMIAVFIWASSDYNRFIIFWMIRGAPYGQRAVIIFRLFFLACVLGGLWQVIETAIDSRRPAMFYLTALPFAAGWIGVFFVMIHVLERLHQKRKTK